MHNFRPSQIRISSTRLFIYLCKTWGKLTNPANNEFLISNVNRSTLCKNSPGINNDSGRSRSCWKTVRKSSHFSVIYVLICVAVFPPRWNGRPQDGVKGKIPRCGIDARAAASRRSNHFELACSPVQLYALLQDPYVRSRVFCCAGKYNSFQSSAGILSFRRASINLSDLFPATTTLDNYYLPVDFAKARRGRKLYFPKVSFRVAPFYYFVYAAS